MNKYPVGRRIVLATGAALAASFSLEPAQADARGSVDNQTVPSMHEVVLSVNGTDRPVQVDTRMTLLDALRDKLGLAGSKKGCDQGQCSACTIHIDGDATSPA